eukprot:SAG22_NODE_718_length_7670_cov_11.194690_1_plen_155_part_10
MKLVSGTSPMDNRTLAPRRLQDGADTCPGQLVDQCTSACADCADRIDLYAAHLGCCTATAADGQQMAAAAVIVQSCGFTRAANPAVFAAGWPAECVLREQQAATPGGPPPPPAAEPPPPPPPPLPSCTNAAELFPVMMQVQAICCTGGVCDGSAM